jgi:hypothetical protein
MIEQAKLQEIARCFLGALKAENSGAAYWLGVIACIGPDEAGEYANAVTEMERREQNYANWRGQVTMLIQLTDLDGKPFLVNIRYIVSAGPWQSSSDSTVTYTLVRFMAGDLIQKPVRETLEQIMALANGGE